MFFNQKRFCQKGSEFLIRIMNNNIQAMGKQPAEIPSREDEE